MHAFKAFSSLSLLTLLGATGGCTTALSAQACFNASGQDFSEVLNCYIQAEASRPLRYTEKGTEAFAGGEVRHFELISQDWSPDGLVSPAQWKHRVSFYIPDHALHDTAVLVANNGTRYPTPGYTPQPPTDMTPEIAQSIARQTRTIVISISDLPNQALAYQDDDLTLRREDALVARSWTALLEDPQGQPFSSIHVPMAAVLVKAMDLAEEQLRPWKIKHFIATGASKRAWSSWLATLADERITGLIPFALDFLNMDKVIAHTYRVYGRSWPLAYGDYQREGITEQFQSSAFKQLEAIHDPARYQDSAYAHRLAVRKYIVSASGDDFFPPDSLNQGFSSPGPTTLRMVPNSAHGGIRAFIEGSLIPAVRLWQAGQALPSISAQVEHLAGQSRYRLQFSQPPEKLVYWQASNPEARDFRYACGIRYQPMVIEPSQGASTEVLIKTTANAWTAGFFEATFANGMVATSRTEVLPDTYPEGRPPNIEPACKTLDPATPLQHE